jgi:ferritin-like metal-binding protein YciE
MLQDILVRSSKNMAKYKTNKSKSSSSTKKTRTRNIHSTSRKGKRLTSKQKLTLYLNDALAIENAAIQRLQSRIKQTKIENAKQRLDLHLKETKDQQNRLKQLISDLSGGKSATKDKAQLPIPTPPKSLTKIVGKMTPAELELKGAKEDAIIENAEIIIYDMLTHLAQKMNAAHAIPILTQSLSEERSMADWIRTNTPDMVIQLWPEIEASVTASEEEDHW